MQTKIECPEGIEVIRLRPMLADEIKPKKKKKNVIQLIIVIIRLIANVLPIL